MGAWRVSGNNKVIFVAGFIKNKGLFAVMFFNAKKGTDNTRMNRRDFLSFSLTCNAKVGAVLL